MSDEDRRQQEFARRAGTLLRDSADGLDGALRSRLARARANALDPATRPGSVTMRYLVPAGAMASAAVIALVMFVQSPSRVESGTPAALVDMDLLADADALELAEESDLDFIEWAAGISELEGAGG